MPITHNPGGSTTLTGDAISFYRLAAMKGAVGLELKGIYMRRQAVWSQAKREFGIKGNKAAVYAWLCAKVIELQAQQEHVSIEGGRTVREVGGSEVQ